MCDLTYTFMRILYEFDLGIYEEMLYVHYNITYNMIIHY